MICCSWSIHAVAQDAFCDALVEVGERFLWDFTYCIICQVTGVDRK